MSDPMTVEVTFQAQEWRGEHARPADRNPNRTSFTIPYEDAIMEDGNLPEDYSYDADALAVHDNAPDWVTEWVNNSKGPFYVQTESIE